MGVEDKLRKMYDYIADNLYLGEKDFEIERNGKIEKYNSTLLFGMLTAAVKGKELIFGEYGLGKTTSSERITSLMYSLPEEVLLSAQLKGHAEQTEEKIVARPDLALLNKGIEKAIWSHFSQVKPKIIDEINRLPPSKQNILLETIDRGNFKYMNETVISGNNPIFATCNYKDVGNTAMSPPLMDRFDIAVESKHPGVNNTRMIRYNQCDFDVLKDVDTAKEFLKVLDNKDLTYDEKQEQIDALSEKFRKTLEERTELELPTKQERDDLVKKIKSLDIDDNATLFLEFMEVEMTVDPDFGQKRSNEMSKQEGHYQGLDLMFKNIKNCMSVRADQSIMKYAKALATFLGDKEVTTEHVEKIFPYAIWHRLEFTEEYLERFTETKRKDPVPLHAAKEAVKAMKGRFSDQQSRIETLSAYLRDDKIDEAKQLAEESAPNHPIYGEFIKAVDEDWKPSHSNMNAPKMDDPENK